MAQKLSDELLLEIFRHRLPKRQDPPWAIQHDFDWLAGQADVARCALVCRGWRAAARDVLFCQPAVRLTPGNAFSFGCLIYGLGRRDRPDSKRPIRSMLFLFSSAEHIDFVTARATIYFAVDALAPPASLFLDNVPPNFLPELHVAPFVDGVAFETLGIRVVDAAAGLCVRYPAKVSLPDMPGLRHLYLCGANCDAIFERPAAVPLDELETLALEHCTLSPRALDALSDCTALTTLFVANMCFSREMETAFRWRPGVHGAWVGIFDVPTFVPEIDDNETDRVSAYCQPWRDPEWRNPPPPCLGVLQPEVLNEVATTSSLKAARFIPACRIWSASLYRPRNPTFVTPPFRAAAAKVDPFRVWSLLLELGLTRDFGPMAESCAGGLVFALHTFRQDYGARARLDDHLARIVGSPVQVMLDQSMGESVSNPALAELYVCFSPVPMASTCSLAPSELFKPSLQQLERLKRWLGPCAGPVVEMAFVRFGRNG